MTQDDVIMSFFPCTRFECQIKMHMSGDSYGMNKWSDEKLIRNTLKLHDEQTLFFNLFSKMFLVAIKKGLRMIIENPYTQPHFLTMYFPIKPSMIDRDRSANGDYFKKPTQYWFIGFKPQTNMLLEADEYGPVLTIDGPHIKGKSIQTSRSMINPTYARKFIYNNVLTKEQAKEARCYTRKAEQSRKSSTSARPS